jgi:hypothetical protein
MPHRILFRDEVADFYESMRKERNRPLQHGRTLSQSEADEFLRSVGKEERRRRAELEWYASHNASDGPYTPEKTNERDK